MTKTRRLAMKGINMGTRHLIAVVLDGEFRIAQYGQWDGYPTGQGEDVRKFVADNDMAVFRQKVDRNCRFMNEDQLELASLDTSPWLSRDMGAKILQFVYDSEDQVFLRDNSLFGGDSLFCEWAYVVDLDKGIVEVYEGFNQTTPTTESDRFHFAAEADNGKYHPVLLKGSFTFDEAETVDMSERFDSKEDDE